MEKSEHHPEKYISIAEDWFLGRNWVPHQFQKDCWRGILARKHGLLHAPTGSGKTYALFIGAALEYFQNQDQGIKTKGLQVLWIAPIRALTRDIKKAAQQFCDENGIPWNVSIRTGDTTSAERQKQKRRPPEVLITTPETLHLLFTQKDYPDYFKNLRVVVVDEWHELMGSKRGVQVELGLSRLKTLSQTVIWGISATIGNLQEAVEILLGKSIEDNNHLFVHSTIKKEVEVIPILPDEVEEFPWAGHLGIKLLHKVIPIIKASRTTLIFTNTRSQSEIWYQKLLNAAPDLAGVIAMHHGSISRELRDWVEEALHDERLKVVVCTSSLDLGVDFRPVDTIIQVGGPKGVARFAQRAGRSGHRPGEKSTIYFLPTHSLELIESAALREAMALDIVEIRIPYVRSFDVLVQYLVTLSISEGFYEQDIFREVISTHAFSSMDRLEWQWILEFISEGGKSLHAYDEYKKVEREADGLFKIANKQIAMRHRMSIGTIIGDAALHVKFLSGAYLGTIEESFISRLQAGDVFWFTGRSLELLKIKDMTAFVKISSKKGGLVPSWLGGRLPLSSQLAIVLRKKLQEAAQNQTLDKEIQFIQPLIEKQRKRSHVPLENELLIEKIKTREGTHVFIYPFEGRFVHEGIAAIVGYRISKLKPLTFTIAYNDYGFELLSDQDIPIEEAINKNVFSIENLFEDIQAGLNSHEMAKRKFRDIASIAGLVFTGFPGKNKSGKHLQSSSQLFYEVFREYEPENLLLRQAYAEVMEFQVEETRLRNSLKRINKQHIILTHPQSPTPFSFPILVDRLREKLSSEKLEDRIKKMSVMFSR